MKKLSVIILTHNNEDHIKDCLETVSFADEIIIVDDYSTDKTLEIAKAYSPTVYKRHLTNDFSRQRNFGLSKAKGEWVLFIDSDERISADLKNEIQHALMNKDADGYVFKRQDMIWRKTLTHGEVGSVRLLRLGRNGKEVFEGAVHEEWKIEGTIKQLKIPILHLSHQSVGEFFSDINTYASMRSKELYAREISVSMFDVIAYPLGKFLYNYILRLGFLDGVQGLMFAICMSFHSFLVRAKLWSLYDQSTTHKEKK